MGFQFQYKEFLLIAASLLFFVLLYFLLLRWKKRIIKKIGDANLVKALIANFSPSLFNIKFITFSVAFLFGVLAVANLRKPGKSNDTVNRKGIDVVIAMDVSKSMLANDLEPNRLERAKQMVNKLMQQMPNDRVALVLFAGSSYRAMPLTIDHTAAAMFVSNASPDAIPAQGTVFSAALENCEKAFDVNSKRFKAIILISDGEDHDEDALKVAGELAQKGIMICTVGIGSAQGAQIPDAKTGGFKRDATGNIVLSKLNEGILQQIAKAANGIYVHLENSDAAVNTLIKEFSQVEKKTFTDVSMIDFKTYYLWFALPMFILLVAEFLIPERKRKLA